MIVMISFDEFSKVELKVGTVLEASEVEGSGKLIKLMVDLGEEKPIKPSSKVPPGTKIR